MSTVQFLYHFNGEDAATTDVDSSGLDRPIYFLGSARLTTAVKKFGSASLDLSISDSAAAVGVEPDGISLSGPFCFQGWLSSTVNTSRAGIIGLEGPNWSLMRNPFSSNNLYLNVNGVTVVQGTGGTINLNTQYHWAWSYDGTTHRLFLEGALVASYVAAGPGLVPAFVWIGATAAGGERWRGQIDEVMLTTGDAVYTAAFTPPTEEFTGGAPAAVLAHAASPGPLGSVQALASSSRLAWAAAPALLGSATIAARHDFTGAIDKAAAGLYTMQVIGAFGAVQVPISNWQATLRAGASSFLQCNVPGCQPYVDALAAATSFVINREARLLDGRPVVYEMARAAVSSLSLAQGTSNYTATLTGFSEGFATDAAPSATFDRPLTGVRQVTTTAAGMRIRCEIDWLLRPGMRAVLNDVSFLVGRISYFVDTASAYMDVSQA